MAENLGTAVLRLEVDDTGLREGLAKARRLIEDTTAGASRRGQSGGRVSGGARESVQALERAQSRRFALGQRIERLEERGAAVARLRARLGDLTTAQSQRQFGTARQISVELDRQVKLANARLRREQDTAAVVAKQARLGGPRESITGRRGLGGSPADLAFLARQGGARSPVGGAANIPGSPAFLAAQRRAGEAQARAYVAEISRLARQGGGRSPIGGAVDIPGSPAFLAAQRRFSAQELSRAAAIGGPRSPIGGALNLPGSPAALRAEQRLAEARVKAAKAANDAAVAEGRRIGKLNASPVRGGAAFPGSPAFLDAQFPAFPTEFFRKQQRDQARQQRLQQERARRRNDVLSNALIGGAFPLLFGQGAGASLGGAAGGAAGGAIGGQFGFGLSLVGTAIGAQVDALKQRFVELGTALQDPTANFDVFIQKAVLASKAQEALAKALQESGQNAAAAKLVQQEAARTIDPIAAEGAAQAQDNFNRALSDTQDVLGNIVAGPASGFLNFLANTLRLISQAPQDGATSVTGRFSQAAADAERRKQGGIAAGLAGLGLALGGAAIIGTGGLAAPLAIGAGLTLGAIGYGSRASADGDTRVATSEAVLALEKQLEAAKERQADIERQILQARGAGKSNLAEQLTLQAQFTALRADELAGLSRIRQEQERNRDGFNDLEDAADATRQEGELRKAIELRRQTLIASASASEASSSIELANAKELLKVFGTQRDILKDRQKIESARRDIRSTQQALKDARESGADPREIKAAESLVNAAINREEQLRIESNDRIRQSNAARVAQSVVDVTNNRLALESIQERIAAARQLGSLEEGVARSTLETALNIRASIAEAKRREQQIGGDISAARIRGEDAEASRLVGKQREAAEETKLRIIEGANALRQTGQSLKKAIIDGADRYRGVLEGSFNLLRSRVQERLVREARGRIDYSLFDERKLRSPQDLFSAASASEQLRDIDKQIADSSKALATVNTELVSTNKQLTEAVAALVQKDWSVNAFISPSTDSVTQSELLRASSLP